MAPTESVYQRSHESQRDNILEGARRVFARKGKAATMADVAEAAGVSQGLAYRYFSGKAEIYRELVQQAMAQASVVDSSAERDASATPGERLARMITRMVELRRDHLDIFQLLDQVLSSDDAPDDFGEVIRQRGEYFFDEFRRLIVEGQASGEVAEGDPDQLVVAIFASVDGLVRFGLHNPEHFKRLCPDASILLRMLRP